MDRAINEGFSEQESGVVGKKTGGEIVRAIDEDVVGTGDLQRVFRAESHRVEFDPDVGIHLAQAGGGAFEFRFPEPGFAVEDLALEIGGVHHVGIDQA